MPELSKSMQVQTPVYSINSETALISTLVTTIGKESTLGHFTQSYLKYFFIQITSMGSMREERHEPQSQFPIGQTH